MSFTECPSSPVLPSCAPSNYHPGVSGSQSSASSLLSIGSFHRTSSPSADLDSDHDAGHLSLLASDIAEYLDPLVRQCSDFVRHPVQPHEYWSLFDTDDFEDSIEGVP